MRRELKKTSDEVYDFDHLARDGVRPGPEVVSPLLVSNYSNVLNIVDQAMEVVSECLLLQMMTVDGQKKKRVQPQQLYLITKSLALIKIVYKDQKVLPAPEPSAGPHHGTYEEWVRRANSEPEGGETKQ